MAIESGASDLSAYKDKPAGSRERGLSRGAYVDEEFRNPKNCTDAVLDADTDEAVALSFADFKADSGEDDSGAEVAEHLQLLGYGPSSVAVDTVVTDIHQQFGADPDDRAVTRFLNGSDEVSMADLNQSELVMAGVHPDDLCRGELVLAPQGSHAFTGRLALPSEVDAELLALQLELQQNFSVRSADQI